MTLLHQYALLDSPVIIIILIYENFGWKNCSKKTEASQEHDKVLKEISIDEDKQEDLNVDINPKEQASGHQRCSLRTIQTIIPRHVSNGCYKHHSCDYSILHYL